MANTNERCADDGGKVILPSPVKTSFTLIFLTAVAGWLYLSLFASLISGVDVWPWIKPKTFFEEYEYVKGPKLKAYTEQTTLPSGAVGIRIWCDNPPSGYDHVTFETDYCQVYFKQKRTK